MLSRYWFCGLLLAAAILSGGCRQATPGSRGFRRSSGRVERDLALDLAAEKQARAYAHFAAGVIHDVNERPDAALREYSEAALSDPDNEGLTLEVSRRLLQSKQPEKAVELLSQATARTNASGALFARLGVAYSQLGKYAEASAADRAAIKRSPRSLAAYQNLFVNSLQNKQPAEALKVLDQAAKESQVDADFLLSLADLYGNFSLQNPSQKESVRPRTLALLERAQKLPALSAPLRMKLADAYESLGASSKAAQVYLDLLKQLPDVPLLRQRIHAKLTDIYLRQQDHQHAVEELQAILRDDPTNPQAYFFLGTIANEGKKTAEAAEDFSKAILLNPNFEQAYYDLAVAQLSLDKISEALATLDAARKRFPQNFVLEFWTGMALSRQKSYSEAMPHFTAAEVMAKATEPKRLNEFFYFQVGATSERKGDYAAAEQYFQKSLEIAPEFAEALNYLGYMWAEHDLHLDKAREMIEKALKQEPKNAAYLDSLAWVLYKLNEPKRALDYALEATRLSEEPDATVYDHLGDIYAALGESQKAGEAWRKSLSLEANEVVKNKLERGK